VNGHPEVRWIECQRLAHVERHGHVKGNLVAMAVDVGQQTRNQGEWPWLTTDR